MPIKHLSAKLKPSWEGASLPVAWQVISLDTVSIFVDNQITIRCDATQWSSSHSPVVADCSNIAVQPSMRRPLAS